MATHKAWGEPGGNGQGRKEGQRCQLHGYDLCCCGEPCVVVGFTCERTEAEASLRSSDSMSDDVGTPENVLLHIGINTN